MAHITSEQVRQSPELRNYVIHADHTLEALGYTEHAFAHVTKVAHDAHDILTQLGYDERLCELAWIAGFLHDIGNVVNRVNHAQSGALMAFRLLGEMGMPADELAAIITAIGNHDEGTAEPVSPMAAALILADKGDVRRSRVRNFDPYTFDIHDRVNYAVEQSVLLINTEKKTITLQLMIDTAICSVMDYFEIFLTRMILSRRAAVQLGLTFKVNINENELL